VRALLVEETVFLFLVSRRAVLGPPRQPRFPPLVGLQGRRALFLLPRERGCRCLPSSLGPVVGGDLRSCWSLRVPANRRRRHCSCGVFPTAQKSNSIFLSPLHTARWRRGRWTPLFPRRQNADASFFPRASGLSKGWRAVLMLACLRKDRRVSAANFFLFCAGEDYQHTPFFQPWCYPLARHPEVRGGEKKPLSLSPVRRERIVSFRRGKRRRSTFRAVLTSFFSSPLSA